MRIETLDLNLLRVFDKIMLFRSVSVASENLGLTQPSTSNALDRLRKASGDRLLERIGNEMVPTQYANDLWPSVREALHALEIGLARIDGFSPETFDKKIRIGMDAFCISFLAPPLFLRLNKEAPCAKLEILPTPPHRNDEDMIRDQCDLIIGPTWRSNPKLAKKVLFQEELVVVARNDHPFAQSPENFDAKGYSEIPHLVYSEGGFVTENVDYALHKLGLKRRVVVSVPFYPAASDILLSTGCVMTVGRALAEALCKTDDLVLMEPPIAIPGFDVSMLWAKRNTASLSHKWLRKTCSEMAYAAEQRSSSAAVKN